MADIYYRPEMVKPLPAIVLTVGEVYGPIDLKESIKSPDEASGRVVFKAELSDGSDLPKGLICTDDGLLGGIIGEATPGNFQINISAKNNAEDPVVLPAVLTVNPRRQAEQDLTGKFKTQVWDALGQNLPLPNINEVMNRPILPGDVYHLLQLMATLTIWDVYNLEPAGPKTLLTLPNANPHYNFYDRGSCLVLAPKELFSHERNLGDALQAARTLAQEVYKRGWTIEIAGFKKLISAAWIELQVLGDRHGKKLEILHYAPSAGEQQLYSVESKANTPRPE
jgi:hypothetical protein